MIEVVRGDKEKNLAVKVGSLGFILKWEDGLGERRMSLSLGRRKIMVT